MQPRQLTSPGPGWYTNRPSTHSACFLTFIDPGRGKATAMARITKRQALLRQATDLFADRGYEATPTVEIATRAGVAEGTLFHHFGTKAGVLREILIDVLDRYFEQASRRVKAAETGLAGLEALVSFHFAFASENRNEMLVVIRDFPYHLLVPGQDGYDEIIPRLKRSLQMYVDCLERGVGDASIRPVAVEETAYMLRSLLYGTTRVALLSPLQGPDLSGTVLDFCRRGLAAHPTPVS